MLRDDMLYRAVKFRHVLDNMTGGHHTSNYIFLGDLNTVGMKYPFDLDINYEKELEKWDKRASKYYGMRRLSKTHNITYRAGSGSSLQGNLDHVYAAKHLNFKQFKNDQNQDVDIKVMGWVDFATLADQDTWIADYSDHSLLYFEVLK